MSHTKPVGRALLFEHLPFVRYKQSAQGVLFVIFSNGDAYFYPLNDQTKGDYVSGNKMPLTKEAPSKKKSSTNLEQYNPNPNPTPNKSAPSTIETASNTKPFAFDITLSLSPDSCKVDSFNFGIEETTDSARVPRKILLSPDKQLLLVIGVLHKEEGPKYFHMVYHDMSFTFLDACFSPDSSCLVAILAKFPSLIFISHLPIPSHLSIPYPSQPKSPPHSNGTHSSSSSTSPTISPDSSKSRQSTTSTAPNLHISQIYTNKKFIAPEPRKIGPVIVLGPATGPLGQCLKMTHISNNSFHPSPHPPPSRSSFSSDSIPPAFQYVTWNDDGNGEYCLWTVTKIKTETKVDVKSGTTTNTPNTSNTTNINSTNTNTTSTNTTVGAGYIYHPRQVAATTTEDTDHVPSTVKCQILSMAFAPAHPHRLLACLRRHGHPRAASNGYGIHMIDTANNSPLPPSSTSSASLSSSVASPAAGGTKVKGEREREGREVWYRVCGEGEAEAGDVVCCKWSNTMLLGSMPSIGVVVKGKGLHELVDHHCASEFQSLHEEFVNTISNFVQVGRYHRYWLNWNGKLRVITVTPQHETPHPEWSELFPTHAYAGDAQTQRTGNADAQRAINIEMRILASRVGYFVNDLRTEAQANLTEPTPTQKKKSTTSSSNTIPSSLSSSTSSASSSSQPSSGPADVLMGLHLYRCFMCKHPLLRPLVCGRCLCAAYCSKKCQLLHLSIHKDLCCTQNPIPTSSSSSSSSRISTPTSPPSFPNGNYSIPNNFNSSSASPSSSFPSSSSISSPVSSSSTLHTHSYPHPSSTSPISSHK